MLERHLSIVREGELAVNSEGYQSKSAEKQPAASRENGGATSALTTIPNIVCIE